MAWFDVDWRNIVKHDAVLPEHNELAQRQNPRVKEFNAKCAGVAYSLEAVGEHCIHEAQQGHDVAGGSPDGELVS